MNLAHSFAATGYYIENENPSVNSYRGYSLPKIQPLKLDNAYFGSTKQINKNLIVDPRVTYCTGIKHLDYLDLIK
jgi:hypothetical protein